MFLNTRNTTWTLPCGMWSRIFFMELVYFLLYLHEIHFKKSINMIIIYFTKFKTLDGTCSCECGHEKGKNSSKWHVLHPLQHLHGNCQVSHPVPGQLPTDVSFEVVHDGHLFLIQIFNVGIYLQIVRTIFNLFWKIP